MATTLTPSQALRRPRRLDIRLVVGAFLTIGVFVGTLAAYAGLSASRDVLVAARDLPVGAVLTAEDLTSVPVRLDDQTYRAAVPASDRAAVTGAVLTAPLYAHQVLARAQFAAHSALAPGQEAFVISLPPDTASGGRFHPGDEIQVIWVKGSKGTADVQASVLIQQARVLDLTYQAAAGVASAGARSVETAGAIATITLAVTPEQAVLLAQAKVAGQLDAARLPPGPEGTAHA